MGEYGRACGRRIRSRGALCRDSPGCSSRSACAAGNSRAGAGRVWAGVWPQCPAALCAAVGWVGFWIRDACSLAALCSWQQPGVGWARAGGCVAAVPGLAVCGVSRILWDVARSQRVSMHTVCVQPLCWSPLAWAVSGGRGGCPCPWTCRFRTARHACDGLTMTYSVEAPLVLGGSVPAAFPRSARCPSMAVEERPAALLLLSEIRTVLYRLYTTWEVGESRTTYRS